MGQFAYIRHFTIRHSTFSPLIKLVILRAASCHPRDMHKTDLIGEDTNWSWPSSLYCKFVSGLTS
ncbi:hypothetical protein [Photobacterium angustum]|uniref:hypothetical protein n=1 Tax=Photobacterium angustum TaxID=661 RepID=UPI0011B1DB22|nr:hypothetical protein [Photobacterium angustum]